VFGEPALHVTQPRHDAHLQFMALGFGSGTDGRMDYKMVFTTVMVNISIGY
jgi:hypothetical protein